MKLNRTGLPCYGQALSTRTCVFGSLLITWTQGTVVMPMMRRLGSKKAFEVGSLFSAAGLLLVSQAWRPFGASKLRMVVQLATAMLVMMPGHVCGVAMVQQPLFSPRPSLLSRRCFVCVVCSLALGHSAAVCDSCRHRRRRRRRRRIHGCSGR